MPQPTIELPTVPEPIAQVNVPAKPQLPPKPDMPADAKTYPKLSRIYQELNQQNDIIFEAEKARNSLEEQRDNLKGISKLTKKGEFQSRIDSQNERIEILKKGLKGIVWRYGYQTVQDFYRSYHASTSAYRDYQSKLKNWENTYGISEQPKSETLSERLDRYQKERTEKNHNKKRQSKDKGAR